MQPLKLTIELVPESAWNNNLRHLLPKPAWDEIRRATYAAYGQRCGICGATGRLEAHELWRYDDDEHVQVLIGIIALCQMCHHVKHIGLAELLADQGKLDFERVARHFMRVNQCDRQTFEAHKREAFAKWQDRSHYEWELDISWLASGGN